MKKNLTMAVLGCASLLAVSANANSLTFTTPGGASIGGRPVDASVGFTTGTDQLTITLTDLQANPTDVSQLLSDLQFGITIGNAGSASLSSGTGTTRTVAGDGTFTDGGSVAAGWVLSNPSAGTLLLNVLSGTGHAGPAHLIIGPPGGATYANANGSIAGNGPHNPFLNGSATFVLDIPGMTVDSSINNVIFSFGTTAGSDISVPDGGTTVLLLGAALSGLGLIRRKLC